MNYGSIIRGSTKDVENLDKRKQATLQWLQDPSELNGDNPNSVRRESRHFRNKEREYLKDKIIELATNSKNKNIRDLYRGINEFKMASQPRSNLVKDDNGDLLADSHILNVRNVSDVGQTVHAAEPLVLGSGGLEVEIAIEKLR
jgi:hypothetical protein